jgi:hypothetical protein
MNPALKDKAWKLFEIAFYVGLAIFVILDWKSFVSWPLLLPVMGIAIGFIGLLTQWLKAERTSRVILRIAQIPLCLWVAWLVLGYIAAFIRGGSTP